MGKIDKNLALKMMLSGDSDSKIGEYFGTSRQAVNLLRKSFCKEGKLYSGQQAKQAVIATSNTNHNDRATLPSQDQKYLPGYQQQTTNYPSFEQITDWIINIIKDAGEANTLRQENKILSSKLADSESQIKQLREELQQVNNLLLTVNQNTKRYEEVIRKLGLPPPGAL